MRYYAFCHGAGYDTTDLDWLMSSIDSLSKNEWRAENPVYFDGSGWSDAVREEAAGSLLEALQENISARKFVFRNTNLGLKCQRSLSDLFRNNHCLQTVSLQNVRQNGVPFAVPSALFVSPSIREVTLDQCTLDSSGCCSLGQMMIRGRHRQSLSSLTLVDVNMQAGVDPLIAALSTCHSLRHLVLREMRMSPKALRSLLGALAENASVEVLNLEKLGLGIEIVESIAHMLRQNRTIAELSLRRNNMYGDSIHVLVSDGLKHNRSLRKLYLSHNPVGDDGAAHLVAGLKEITTLSEVCLVHAEIWRPGCLAIASELGSFRGLRRLSMDGNEMEACALHLLSSLEQNVWLEHILLDLPYLVKGRRRGGGGSSDKIWRLIDLCLRWNKAKRRALVEANVDRKLMPRVLQRAAEQPDVMFCFLSRMPDIMATSG